MKQRNYLLYLFIFVIALFVNTNNINALTCTYKSPVTFIDTNEKSIYKFQNKYLPEPSAKFITVIITSSSSKDASATISSSTFGTLNVSEISTSIFSDLGDAMCPSYISADLDASNNVSLDKINLKKYKTDPTLTNSNNYQMALFSTQRDSNVEFSKTTQKYFLNYNLNNVNSTMNKVSNDLPKNFCTQKKSKLKSKEENACKIYYSASSFIEGLTKDLDVYELASKNSSFISIYKKLEDTKYLTAVTEKEIENRKTEKENKKIEEEISEKEKKIKEIENNFCSLYCEYKCENSKKDANSCKTSCENKELKICQSAVNVCSKISSSTSKEECFKKNMSDYDDYLKKRNEKIQKLREEIGDLRLKIVNIRDISDIGEIEYVGYSLKCSDVVIFHDIWIILIIIAPILTIVMGSVDMLFAVIASDPKKMEKARKNLPKRFIALIITIIVPTIVSIIVNFSYDEEVNNTNLMYCIIKGGE